MILTRSPLILLQAINKENAMDHTKKHKKKWNNRNRRDNQKKERLEKTSEVAFVAENSEAIRLHKENVITCEYCSRPIHELVSALVDKKTGGAIHFDCVLSKLNETENLEEGQKITYIGQGRFAVVHFENPHDLRKFSIVKTIDWEDRDSPSPWREEIAGLYSQVK